jgi:hypothetical protein
MSLGFSVLCRFLWQLLMQVRAVALDVASMASRCWHATCIVCFPSAYVQAPGLKCLDARCDRVKFFIYNLGISTDLQRVQISYLSADADDSQWILDSWNKDAHRVIPRLKADTTYLFRCRCRMGRCVSPWGPHLSVQTLQRPVNGGGQGPGYTWTQTASEVAASFPVPMNICSKHVRVQLNSRKLRCELHDEAGECHILVDTSLPKRVRPLSPEGGSYWELDVKQDNSPWKFLNLVLEKETVSDNIKFGYWRTMFVGGPKIDTHAIDCDNFMNSVKNVGARLPGFDITNLSRSELKALKQRVQRL